MGTFSLLVAGSNEIERIGLCAVVRGQPSWAIAAEARDGREAVEKTKRLKPDVTIMYFDMPALNGLEAARQIVKGALQTRVLLLAPYHTDWLLAQALEAGVRGYLLRSDTADDLVSAVEALCQGRPFFTARVAQGVIDRYWETMKKTRQAGGKDRRQLTGREREILQLVAEGHSCKEIGVALNVSAKTAQTHRANIMEKIDCHRVAGLVRYALRNRIVEA